MTPTAEPSNLCPLCGREMDQHTDEHHLIPKLKKGKKLVRLHVVCHRKIHSLFSEQELASYYNTIERLLENEDIQKFRKWIQKKDINYVDSSKMANNHSKRNKR